MIVTTYRNVFFAITGAIVAASIAALLFFGLNFGTDFTGGTSVQVSYVGDMPTAAQVDAALAGIGVPQYAVRSAGESAFDIRAGNLTDEMRGALPQVLSVNGAYTATITRMNEVGPTIGKELRTKAVYALILVILAILIFVAFVFRKVSRPVSSWVYGSIAVVTLVHDVIVPLGFFAVLGHYFGAQVDTLFVTAILTILGFSVHDTIVVFDRVRENLKINQDRNRHESFEFIVGKSLNQTLVRSVNTSLTVLITLLALFFFGPASTQDFALVLLVGIVAGTYSSIALASPLLVAWEKRVTRA